LHPSHKPVMIREVILWAHTTTTCRWATTTRSSAAQMELWVGSMATTRGADRGCRKIRKLWSGTNECYGEKIYIYTHVCVCNYLYIYIFVWHNGIICICIYIHMYVYYIYASTCVYICLDILVSLMTSSKRTQNDIENTRDVSKEMWSRLMTDCPYLLMWFCWSASWGLATKKWTSQ